MKIVYFLTQDQDYNLGITRKIGAQITAWQKKGHSVKIFNMIVNKNQSKKNILNANIYLRDSILKGNKKLHKDLLEFNPDIVYMRFEPYKPFIVKILKTYKTIVEINTDDLSEQKLLAKKSNLWKLKYIYNLFTRGFIFRNSSGLVTVTEELKQNIKFSKYKLPTIAIPNSINLKEYIILKNRQNNIIPQLYFMGNFNRSWHGLNKIIELAKMTKNELHFHIVGGESNALDLPDNITFYGYLSRSKYLDIMQKCDICIGSLAFHKIPLVEASPLKVREYIAYGFPIILGYKDSAFLKDNPDWVLEIPNTEENIRTHQQEIVNFCNRQKGRILKTNEIVNIVDSDLIEMQKIDFFKEISLCNS